MKLYIKNMVCSRCIHVVKSVLDELNISVIRLALGEVGFGERTLTDDQIYHIKEKIESFGFELIGDKKSRLIETFKKLIIELVQKQDGLFQLKLSDYLANN